IGHQRSGSVVKLCTARGGAERTFDIQAVQGWIRTFSQQASVATYSVLARSESLSEERRFVSGGFLTANPEYWRYFRSLLKVLLSHGEGYTPQFIELGKHDNYKTIPFETGKVEELAKKWDTQTTDTPGWDLQKHRPNKLSEIGRAHV